MAEQKNKYSIVERFLDKCLSARFLVTVILAGTLAYAVVACFNLIGMPDGEPEILAFRKEIFMYVMGVFSGIVGSVVASYFGRQDRVTPTVTPDDANGLSKP